MPALSVLDLHSFSLFDPDYSARGFFRGNSEEELSLVNLHNLRRSRCENDFSSHAKRPPKIRRNRINFGVCLPICQRSFFSWDPRRSFLTRKSEKVLQMILTTLF